MRDGKGFMFGETFKPVQLERRSVRDPSGTYVFVIQPAGKKAPVRSQSGLHFVLGWEHYTQVVVGGR